MQTEKERRKPTEPPTPTSQRQRRIAFFAFVFKKHSTKPHQSLPRGAPVLDRKTWANLCLHSTHTSPENSYLILKLSTLHLDALPEQRRSNHTAALLPDTGAQRP